jgi:ribosomal protein S18 acetylase RimI-like enzyme
MFKTIELKQTTADAIIPRYVQYTMKMNKGASETEAREYISKLFADPDKAPKFDFFDIHSTGSGELLGNFWLYRASADVMHIASFQIEEAKQHQGYGSAAMIAFKRMLTETWKDIAKITLTVSQSNLAAKRLYDKMGFIVAEEAHNGKEPIFRMALSLGPKSVHLKEMAPAETEAIIPKIETEYADLMAKTGKSPSEATSFFDQLFPSRKAHINQHFFSIIDHETNEVVGQIWLMTDPSMPYRTHIMDIRVNKEKQHQGYGKAALLEAEKVALKWGVTNISLNVAEDNPARNLYEKMGYEDCDRAKGKMQKRITPETAVTALAGP